MHNTPDGILGCMLKQEVRNYSRNDKDSLSIILGELRMRRIVDVRQPLLLKKRVGRASLRDRSMH